jgi:hypothetical protein
LPIIVNYLIYSYYGSKNADPKDEDDVIAALEHPDRVRHVEVVVTSSLLEKMATAMQQPFTELTRLRVSSIDGRIMPVLPGSFLGGSAPSLRDILLDGIPFPSLPTLLSSAGDLVTLKLYNIPQTGYISPEAMVTSLTASTRLITLSIRFQSPTPRPNQRLPASLTRVDLASLTSFEFYGVCEYLEDFVARIDAPQLTFFKITYFNQLDFQVPELSQFITRAEHLQAAPFERAFVYCRENKVSVCLRSKSQPSQSYLSIQISCQGLDWQLSSITQLISQSSTVVSSVRHLSIDETDLQPTWRDDIDFGDWLPLLRPFVATQTLCVGRRLRGHISLALEDVAGATVAEVLPYLHYDSCT